MALNIKGNKPAATTAAPATSATEVKSKVVAAAQAATGTTEQTAVATVPAKTSPAKGFLKMGATRKKLIEAEHVKQELLSSRYEGLRRFWVPNDKQATLIFLDGDLDEDGMLDVPVFYQHGVNRVTAGGKKQIDFYVCIQDNEVCPLCDGHSPSLVGVFTVIEEVSYETDDGPVVNPKRLYVAPQRTLNKLQQLATELGGLRNVKITVSREGEQSPSVGNVFEPVLQYESKEELLESLSITDAEPANYTEEIKYYSGAELATMGVADYTAPVGSADSKAPQGKTLDKSFKESL